MWVKCGVRQKGCDAVPGAAQPKSNVRKTLDATDLLHRAEVGTERHYSWWLKIFSDRRMIAQDFLKSHAIKAADIMTKRVITARPDTPLADMLEQYRIKRVPIVENGKLVGIVSRANLLQALAAPHRNIPIERGVEDSALRERTLGEIRTKLLAGYSSVNVIVHHGTAELWGEVGSSEEKNALRIIAELTPGVRLVSDYLAVGTTPRGF